MHKAALHIIKLWEVNMNFKLKARIIERFGTQADFGEAIGIDDSIISKIIRGRRKLDPEKQSVWARALGCDPKDIFVNEIPNSK